MGKILLVSFEGDEEELVNSVISVLDSGREKFLFSGNTTSIENKA